jgi:hypothetical protein
MLHSYNRRPKQVTSGLIPDDGFRELEATNTTHFKNPQTYRVEYKPVISMLNKENFDE